MLDDLQNHLGKFIKQIPLSYVLLFWFKKSGVGFTKLTFKKCIYLFIWLGYFLVVAWRIFALHCSIWDLVFWPGIEPRPPALGVGVLATGPLGKSLTIFYYRTFQTCTEWKEYYNEHPYTCHLISTIIISMTQSLSPPSPLNTLDLLFFRISLGDCDQHIDPHT